MEISEQCVLPLDMENITDFRSKKEEERRESKNLEIDVQVNEEDEQLLKLREIPRRKSSTGSTSASKPEDPSELFSYPSLSILLFFVELLILSTCLLGFAACKGSYYN